jgi:CRISPR-associated endonuclease Csn1
METQQKYHPELQDRDLYAECVSELYASNENYRNSISGRDFVYLFVDDIIFYQRPLKSKKSLIADCPYESVKYIKDGKETQVPLKCIAKSHPLFQEFRLWQFLSNLKIYQKEKHDIFSGGFKTDVDVTNEFITCESDYVNLFDWLNDKNNIEQKNFLAYPGFKLKKDNISKYRWNYVEDKSYPCNETRAQMLASLNKAGVDSSFLTKEKEEALWHILYSIDDKTDLRKALAKFAEKNSLGERFVEVFQKTKPFEKEYGAYSAKAIKKLLSLMRTGYYWKQEAIDNNTAERIEKIITGEADDAIRERAREKAKDLKDIIDFKGLPLWLACYVVYDIHSESKDSYKWETPEDIDTYLKSFKQHSLRNPIVEKVVMETLRTVRDIWKEYGKIDEIHIEMGRNMKQTAAQRKADTIRNLENENTNLRIKTLLMELANPRYDVENVRPFSPSQQDLLRIYEEGVFDYVSDVPDDIKEIKSKLSQTDKTKKPSSSDVMRYKCWLEQKYQSPYTGSIIP